MKHTGFFILFFSIVCVIVIMTGCQKDTKIAINDQSLLAVKEEFEAGRYEKVLTALEQYKDSLETNSRVAALKMKAESLENLVDSLNRKLPQTNTSSFVRSSLSRYSSYDIKFIDGRFHYLGNDYKRLYNGPATEKERIYFKSKHLDLNNPFQWKGQPQSSQIAVYAALARELSSGVSEKAEGSHKEKSALAELLFNVFQNLAFTASGTNLFNEKDIKPYIKDLDSLSDAVIGYSDNKKLVLSALMTKIHLYRYKNQADKAHEVMEKVIKDFGNEKYAAFVHAWLGDYHYIRGDLSKAKKSYSKADRLFSSSSYPLDELRMMVPGMNDFEQKKSKISKMINLIQSEMDYERFIQNSKRAIVVADNVRLRQTKEAVSSKNVITTLNTGDKVVFLRRSEEKVFLDGATDYWYLVRLRNGNEGWIFGKFLLVF